MPKFSVIIPTFNRALKLKECLNSLVEQTFKDFEVIVCDDGSTDNTTSIIESFKNKLDIIYHKSTNSGGPARPRNTGLNLSNGEWVCFLDSDDMWKRKKLEVVNSFTKEYDFIAHDATIGTKSFTKLFTYSINKLLRVEKISFQNLINTGNFINCSSVSFRKEIFIRELFNEEKNLVALEDYLAWLRIVSNPNVKTIYINKALSIYQIHSENISKPSIDYILKLLYFKNKVLKMFPLIKIENTCLNYLIGTNLLKLGKKNRARKYLLSSLKNARSLRIKFRSVMKLLSK